MTSYPEKKTAITGIGQSKISRGADKSALGLTIDAALEAISDAGLTRADIDGCACWPGGSGIETGFAPVSIGMLQDALRLKFNWYSNASETAGQFGALFNAVMAVATGVCRHVLVYRTMFEATARKTGFANALNRPGDRVSGPFEMFAPYHAYAAATQQALYFQRYVHESGLKPEQQAMIAINGRRNAAINPAAVYRTPITLDDYFNAPIISTPLRIFDCDVPIDGSVPFLISIISREVNEVVRDPWSSTSPSGKFLGSSLVDGTFKELAAPEHDLGQVLSSVVVQTGLKGETTAHRRSEQANSRCRANQSESGNVEPYASGVRPLVDHDIDTIILHGGVKVFFHRLGDPMNLVDK